MERSGLNKSKEIVTQYKLWSMIRLGFRPTQLEIRWQKQFKNDNGDWLFVDIRKLLLVLLDMTIYYVVQ